MVDEGGNEAEAIAAAEVVVAEELTAGGRAGGRAGGVAAGRVAGRAAGRAAGRVAGGGQLTDLYVRQRRPGARVRWVRALRALQGTGVRVQGALRGLDLSSEKHAVVIRRYADVSMPLTLVRGQHGRVLVDGFRQPGLSWLAGSCIRSIDGHTVRRTCMHAHACMHACICIRSIDGHTVRSDASAWARLG